MDFQRFSLLTLFVLVALQPCHGERLEVTGRQRLVLAYDYAGRGGEGRFFLPIPPDTGCQKIESFHSSWPGTTVSAGPVQRVLTGRVPAGRGRWHVEVAGVFTMHELVEDGSPLPPPTLARPAGFDGATESIDWKSDSFQRWLDAHGLRRGKDERGVRFARRVYDFLLSHGAYSYPPSGGWTASGASRRLRTDCGGFSLVFVAACRANHVPARLLVGQWLKVRGRALTGGRQAHVISEFWDAGLGWIPVDLSSTLMHVGGRSDYFGREAGYFFAWHVDTDFHFDVPGRANGHVQWIENPAPWFANGEGGGSRRWSITPQ